MAEPPTADELWFYRFKRARDALSFEQGRRFRELMSEAIACKGRARSIIKGVGWAPNPDFGSEERWNAIWAEVGEELGIGPPPWVS